jgi:hypothetical protein
MNRVERFDVIGNQLNEFLHNGLDSGWIANLVGASQEDAVKAFIISTDLETLSRRPFGIFWMSMGYGVLCSAK